MVAPNLTFGTFGVDAGEAQQVRALPTAWCCAALPYLPACPPADV